MKRFLLVILPLFALMLSGCSPSSPSEEAGGGSIVDRLIPQGFSQKTQKGSVWKSEDGGRTFFVQSTVNEKSRIEKADILDFAFHPTKPETVIMSSVSSGIFKTENGGDTWLPIAFPPQRIYSFIIDRRDPDRRMFASGILENRGRIFRTDDEGANWTPIYVEPGEGTVVSALAQDPRRPDVLYAGTSSGTLIRSTDAGSTWENIGESVDGLIGNIFFDVEREDYVYLLLFNKGMRVSRDRGATWVDWDEERREEINELAEQAASLSKAGDRNRAETLRARVSELREKLRESPNPNGVITLLPDPSRSGVLYAGTGKGQLYRSEDFGKYWTEMNIIESARQFPIRSVAIDPKNPRNIVFVSGRAMYRSETGGETWSVTPLSTDRPPFLIRYDPFDSRFIFMGLRATK